MVHRASIGRIVHYYQGDCEAPAGVKRSKIAEWPGTNGTRMHPAIITKVHTDTCVNLMIQWDAGKPSARTFVRLFETETFMLDELRSRSGWRWPERVS